MNPAFFDADACAAWWAGLPLGAAVAAKATAALMAAWALAALLRRRDPRARVLAWRASAVGLALAAGLALPPPAVGWRPRRPGPPPVARDVSPQTPPVVDPGFVPPSPELASPPQALTSEADAAREHTEPARASIDPGRFLRAGWLIGVAAALLRWATGLARLAAIVRRSEDAPADVIAEAHAVAERLGVRRSFRVARSAEVAVPCLAGVPGLVVLLPDGPGWPADPRDRRAILAHELAHARGRDLGWNDAFRLIGALLWFHPLAWRLRAAHASACDDAADARAAGLLGDARAYAGVLARLALAAASAARPPAAGLAMARRADVRRRIDALLNPDPPSPPSRRSAMLAPLAVGTLCALLGTAGVLPAAQDPPPVSQGPALALPEAPGPLPADPLPTPFATPAPTSAPANPKVPAGRVVVRAVDAATNQPLAGVEVSASDIAGGEYRGRKVVTTDAAGVATVAYEPRPGIIPFDLTLRRPGYAPESMRFSGLERPIAIPPSIEIRLEPGRMLGGLVVDEADRPVAGANVRLMKPLARSEMRGASFQFASPTTDAAGRWETREAPADLSRVNYSIRHPGYLPTYIAAAGGPEVRAVLVRGATVRGTVVSVDGTPILGARVVLGRGLADVQVTSATADREGRFELLGCPVGPTLLTVQQDSFAPQVREVRVEPGDATPPVDFRLEPGSTLRLRVVDPAGRPIPGATVVVNSYGGGRSLSHREKADADGRIVWRGAPPDAFDLGFFAAGHQRKDITLTAGPDEQVVTLAPELVVSGRVTDARTGAAIPEFAITTGATPAYWTTGANSIPWPADRPRPTAWRSTATAYRDGRYERRCDNSTAHEWFLRVEVPGYRVAESRGYRLDEGAQTWDVALEPEAWVTGVVVGPDGRPVAEPEVAVVPWGRQGGSALLRGAAFGGGYGHSIRRADAAGRFSFPPAPDDAEVFAASPAGLGRASVAALRESGRVALRPWGRVEGRVLVGGRPAPGAVVTIRSMSPARGAAGFVMGAGDAPADSDGRFSLDHVVPGPVVVARVVRSAGLVGGSLQHELWAATAEVPAGGTATVTVGGGGRAVAGRIILDGIPADAIDWVRNRPIRVRTVADAEAGLQVGSASRTAPQFQALLDPAGRFRVEEVPPGRYRLELDVSGPPAVLPDGVRNTRVGAATLDFDVPAGDGAAAVDLGDIPARPAPDYPRTRP